MFDDLNSNYSRGIQSFFRVGWRGVRFDFLVRRQNNLGERALTELSELSEFALAIVDAAVYLQIEGGSTICIQRDCLGVVLGLIALSNTCVAGWWTGHLFWRAGILSETTLCREVCFTLHSVFRQFETWCIARSECDMSLTHILQLLRLEV